MSFYKRFVFPRLCDLILNRPLLARQRRLLLSQVGGEVLEIGFGTGLNLPFYPATVRRLTTVDPNVGMHSLARRRIQRVGITVAQHQLSGERLPFEDHSFDFVVSTFTLCSITDVHAALYESFRVLKPGGRFLFLEHGLSPDPSVRWWQHRLNSIEMQLADGCHLDRDIRALIANQPFSSVQIDQFYLESFPRTHGYMSRGIATKGAG